MNFKFLQSAFDKLGSQKDLLVEIKDNTEKTATAVSAGGELFDRMDRMVTAIEKIEQTTKSGQGGLQQAILLKLVAPSLKPIGLGLQFIIDALESAGSSKELSEKMDALTKGLVVLGDVGLSILKFAGYMILATPLLLVAAVAAPIWMGGLYIITKGLMAVTESLDKERLEKIALLGDVGMSILTLAGTLALTAVLAIPAMIGLVAATVLLVGIAGVFKILDMIGADPEKMENFGKSIKALSIGLLLLGGTLALLSIVAMPVLKGLAVGMAIIAGIGLTFFLLDKLGVDKSMRKMALDLMLVSLSLVTLGLALNIMSALVPPMEDSLYLLAIVGGTALVFGLAGMFASQIAKGALVMALAGLSLVVLGFGLEKINEGMPQENRWEFIGQVAAVVGGLAVVMALAGVGASLIIQGAISMILASASLVVLGFGLQQINAGMPKEDRWEFIGQVGAIVGGLGVAMALAGAGAPFIAAGAGVMILAGGALAAIGLGLRAIASVDFATLGSLSNGKGGKPFDWSGEVSEGFLGFGAGRKKTNFEIAMESIAAGMALGPLSIAGILAGAPTLILASTALIGIAIGLRKFKAIAAEADLPALSDNMRYIVGGLSDVFAEVGQKYPGGGGGILAALSGSGSDTSVVAQGISAVGGMGKALKGIARGVQAMAELKFPTGFDKDGNPTGFETINVTTAVPALIANTKLLVTGLSSAFAEVGESDAAQGSSWFTSSSYEKGIKVVRKMGEPLYQLANGVQAMANLKFPTGFDKDGNPTGFKTIGNVDKLAVKLANNTKALVKALTSVFEDVGNSSAAQGGGWFSSNAFEKGAEIIQDLADPYESLAETLESVKKIMEGVADGEALRLKVKNMVAAIVEAPSLGEDATTAKFGFIYTVKRMYDNLSAAVGPAGRIIEGITDGEALKLKIKQMVDAMIGPTGEDVALIYAKGAFMGSLGRVYTKLAVAIPPIVAAMNAFAVEKGKAFTAIFGGETPADMYEPKQNLLKTLTTSYMKMAVAIPLIVGSIGSVQAETMDNFTKIYGGSMQADPEILAARTTLFVAAGDSYEKIGTATKQISSAVSNTDQEKLEIWQNMFVGPVGKLRPGMGYRYQEKLWKAIGANMGETANSYTTISSAINAMDMDKLVESRRMFEALGVLAEGGESPEDILEAMGESLEAALQNLAAMLEQFNTTVTEQGDNQTNLVENLAAVPGNILEGISGALTGGGSGNSREVVNAVNALTRILSRQGIKISNLDDALMQ